MAHLDQRQALRNPQPPEPNSPKLQVESLQGARSSDYSNRVHAENFLDVVRSVEKRFQEALPRHELSIDFWRIEHDLELRQQRFGRIRC